jgi:hypothetical protein
MPLLDQFVRLDHEEAVIRGDCLQVEIPSVEKAMFQYQAQWADVLAITITPCLEDADAGAVMASLGKR